MASLPSLILIGSICGGLVVGVVVASWLYPALFHANDRAMRRGMRATRWLIGTLIFGGALVGGGATFRALAPAGQLELWASFLIGLAPAFLFVWFRHQHDEKRTVQAAQRVRQKSPKRRKALDKALRRGAAPLTATDGESLAQTLDEIIQERKEPT